MLNFTNCQHWRSTLRLLQNVKLNEACTTAFSNAAPTTSAPRVYEFRKYNVKPDKMAAFVRLNTELFHLRTNRSKVFGYWNVEFGGGLHEVIHIWEYDNFAHRTTVRAALADDAEWNEKFIPVMLSCLVSQQNSIMYMPNWCRPNIDKKHGIYDLVTYGMKKGGPAVWEEKLKSSLFAHARLGYTDLVGVWYTDLGNHNDVQVLWRYDSLDGRTSGRNLAHQDAVVVNKVRDNLNNVDSHRSLIMNPTAWWLNTD